MSGVSKVGAEEVLIDMRRVWEEARQEMIKARDKQKEYADRHRRDEKYEAGEQVMLSTKNLSSHQSKLSDAFVGPFTIRKVLRNGVNVRLDLPSEYSRLHQTFHINLLKRFIPSEIDWPGRIQLDRPPPVWVNDNGEEEWEVEKILGRREAFEWVVEQPKVDSKVSQLPQPAAPLSWADVAGGQRRSERLKVKTPPASSIPSVKPKQKARVRRVKKTVTQYLVKWKGYDVSEASWENESNLRGAEEAVNEYECQQGQDEEREIMNAVLYQVVVETDSDGRQKCSSIALT
jgi:hypothetical protein